MSTHSSESNSGTEHTGISSWAIRRPIGTLMITSTLLVLGLVYVGRIPVDLLPRIIYPQVNVNVMNPGVEPAVMEETIAKPLEAALSSTQNLTRIGTTVSQGNVRVTLDFAFGTNVDYALQDAAKNVERVRARLPEEADPPNVSKNDPTQQAIYSVAFSSTQRTQTALRQWVDQRLRPQLLSIDGVAAVNLNGGLVREIQVQLDPERLRGYGLSVSQVITSLRNENQDVAVGRISTLDREMVGTTAGKFHRIEDLSGVLLSTSRGARVPLRDVATIRDTSQEQRQWARLNGVPAVRIDVQKQPEANTVEVARGVRERIDELVASGYMPPDLRFETTYDQSGFINDALHSVRNAAVIGAVLAMVVVIIFLRSFRKTFIICISIPLVILATFVLMGAADLTLNVMSLGGLALGVGILLDNAIVMLENIYRRKTSDGLSPEEAAHVGAKEVTSPIIASTTTHLASVLPFLLITGLAALLFRELILTISFATAASLPLALTLVPMLAAQFGKVKFESGLDRAKPLLAFERAFDRMRLRYRSMAIGAVKYRWAMMGGVALLAVGAGLVARTFATEFIPQVDDGNVTTSVMMGPGTPPRIGNQVTLEVEKLIKEMPGVKGVFANAGGRGNMDIRLDPAHERSLSSDAWVLQLQKKVDERAIPGARIFVRPSRLRGLRTNVAGADVAVAVVGDELPMLDEIGNEIIRRLRDIPGLQSVQMQQQEPNPMMAIALDRERARALNLDVATVGQTVRTALDGTIATRYTEGNFEYDVRVLFPKDRVTAVSDLSDVLLFPGGRGTDPIFLRDVATLRPQMSPANIRRENQNRRIEVTGDVITEVAPIGRVTDSVKARLADLQLPDGYGIIIGGEQEAINDTNKQMALIIGLAVFLVFVVLAVQYESMLDPFIILGAIPLGMIGVVAILWITKLPLSAPVMLGVIMLVGILANNSILMVEFAKHFHEQTGGTAKDAVVEAGVVRMRPIVMTTIVSVVGALPIALGLEAGGELMRPLAIALVGGLSVSALLTLFVVPALYVIVHEIGDKVKVFVLGSKAELRTGTQVAGEVAG